MSETGKSSGSSTARIVLGMLTLVLLVGTLLAVFLLGRSVGDAEAEAQTRAVNWTNSVLVGSLTDAQVRDPLVGSEYRDVLVAVQNGIRSDARAARVRIWNEAGVLVFSDDPDEQVGEVVATDVPEIRRALGGQAVSVTSEATVPAQGGLTGSEEQLFQTYVPFRPDAELGVSGVVQIDQRYDEIVGGWSQTWTAIRLGLGIALAVVFVLFLVSLRRRPTPVEAAASTGAPVARPAEGPPVADRAAATKAEKRVRDLGERLAKSEAAKTEAEAARAEAETIANEAASHFAELEDRVAKAEERATSAEAAARAAAAPRPAEDARPRRGVPGVGAAAAPADADGRVKQADAERERLAGEVGRLRSALAERDAELALAREQGGMAGAADVDELRRQATVHEERAARADERATQEGDRAAQAEHRIAELERELQAALATAEAATSKPKRGHRDRHADDEIRVAHERAAELETKLAEITAALEEARGSQAAGDARASELETANTGLIDDLEALRTDAAKASDEIAALKEALAAAQQDASSKEVEERVAATAAALAEAQDRLAVAERDRAELLGQLETYREAGDGAGGDDARALRARIVELEDVRRADVAELQRAQETLANTQFEARQARTQVKELEQQLREALGRPAASAEPAQEPAVPAARPRRRAPKEAPEPAFVPDDPFADAEAEAEEPEEPEKPEQELSLRERLARAAAARHRMTGPSGSE